jgi:hypothetical protein
VPSGQVTLPYRRFGRALSLATVAFTLGLKLYARPSDFPQERGGKDCRRKCDGKDRSQTSFKENRFRCGIFRRRQVYIWLVFAFRCGIFRKIVIYRLKETRARGIFRREPSRFPTSRLPRKDGEGYVTTARGVPVAVVAGWRPSSEAGDSMLFLSSKWSFARLPRVRGKSTRCRGNAELEPLL